MFNIILRTILFYFLLLFSIRAMGKRQIGEMQTSEFIITILLSEIASSPIPNPNQSVMHAAVSVLVLAALEILVSFLLLRSNLLKRLFYGAPSVLIRRGRIDQGEMRRCRMEIDELMSELRQAGFADPSEVYYAVLEENGRLSVFPRADKAPASPSYLGLTPEEKGLAHVCVIDGTAVEKNLSLAGWDRARLDAELRARGLTLKDVFVLTVDDAGGVICVGKERS